MEIYKILRADEWAQFGADGRTRGAPIDLADGYIHFSTAGQVSETLSKHFGGCEGLEICACDTDTLGDALKWEPSRGGALFPHLYRALNLSEVVWHETLPVVNGTHRLPDLTG